MNASETAALAALRESEVRHKLALEVGRTFAFEWEPATDRVRRSESCGSVLGLSTEEAVLDTWQNYFQRVHPDDRQRFLAIQSNLKPGADSYRTEYRLIRGDGTEIFLLESARGFFDVRGQLQRLVGTITDITERKRLEEALRETEALRAASLYARNLIESSLDPLVTISPDGKVTDVNSATEAVTGWSRDELIGTEFADYFTEPMAARDGYQQAFQMGSVRDYALGIRHRYGHLTPVLYNAAVYRNEAGKVVGVFAAARDVTETKKAEEALRESEDHFRHLVQAVPIPLCFITGDAVIQEVNDRFTEILGYSLDDIPTAGAWFERAYPDETYRQGVIEIWDASVRKAMEESVDIEPLEYRVTCKNGNVRVMLISGIPIGDNLLVTFVDLTERKRVEEALRASEARFDFALQNSLVGAWELDLLDHTTNRTLIHDRIYGYETMLPRWTYEIFLEHVLPEDRPEVDRIFHDATAAKADWSCECRIRRADGEVRWIYVAGGHLQYSEGKTNRVSGIVQDITERKLFQEKLEQQATTDEITGVTNRRRFLELAHIEIKRALRLKRPLTIALSDIDHFKQINDAYGHATGDKALLALTQLFKKNIREIDVFARFGGDEFVLLLPEISSEQACEVMERICVALASQPIDLGGKLVWITISSGIASLVSEDESLETLLERVDQALYRAKEAGRNRVMVEHTVK